MIFTICFHLKSMSGYSFSPQLHLSVPRVTSLVLAREESTQKVKLYISRVEQHVIWASR